MKARGALARLEALENQARARVAAVEGEKTDTWANAALQLPAEQRSALHEHLNALENGGTRWAEVCRAAQALQGEPLEDSAGAAARAWSQALEDTPEGVLYPLPPAGTAAYCELEAARCEAERLRLAEYTWPEGVTLEALDTVARGSAAWWHYEAAYAVELGDTITAAQEVAS
ncbi:hypothetical protein Q0M94_27990 (plasmid) [Deinococcus radiomollis]|uniref:hypothetical protein n=1 Tax=Deinococcus radiomollis TaxID=468916 RepID=UPI003892357E